MNYLRENRYRIAITIPSGQSFSVISPSLQAKKRRKKTRIFTSEPKPCENICIIRLLLCHSFNGAWKHFQCTDNMCANSMRKKKKPPEPLNGREKTSFTLEQVIPCHLHCNRLFCWSVAIAYRRVDIWHTTISLTCKHSIYHIVQNRQRNHLVRDNALMFLL